ncbi:hypothetical protein ACQPUZ_16310 [Clostridium tertium]
MQNTTSDYKLEITKDNIEVEAKITIGNNIYTSSDITNLVLEYSQPQEGFAIGNTLSQSLDLTLLNRKDIIYNTSQIKLEIGLKIGSTIEYIPMGIFNIDDVEKTDYTTKFTCYDNMIKFEKTFSTSLGDTLTLQQVISELTRITGVEFIGSLPSYTVKKLEGFSCREVLGYVASICGGNAVITRDGKFTIKGLTEVEKTIDGHNIILNNYKTEEIKYKVGQVSCQADENNILSKGSLGTDSMELQFENPWVNESILNDIYNKVKSVEYLGYSMKWTGDLALDVYDVVSVTDAKNITRKLPILSQKITCTKGIVSEIGAKGETKNKNSFSSSGSTTNKVNRAVMELAVINQALIDKANIRDLEAVSIRTQTLEAKTAKIEEIIIDVAHIKDLNAINASIQNLIAADANITKLIATKADITDLTATNIKFNVASGGTLDLQTLLSKFVTGENGQFINISSSNSVIANATIKNAMIESLSVDKLLAGRISTNKFTVSSDDGGIEIVGATQQFKDKNNKVRIQMGQDTQGNFNFILRGEDGTTTLIDHTGIKENAIADDLIKSNMVAADAIGEKQINYSSLITGLNKDDNTQLIKASKVAIDLEGQTLDVAFNSLKSNVDNMEIGGRNLVIGTSREYIGRPLGQYSVIFNNTGTKDITEYGLKTGDVVTLRAYLKSSGTKPLSVRISFYTSEGKASYYYGNTISAGKEGYSTLTMKVPNDAVQIALYIQNKDSTLTTTTNEYYKELKFEKGNKATDWTPAPEDTEEKIEANTTSIIIAQGKIDGLIKETSITKGDITTLKDNYTSIKATVDGINTTVANHTSSIKKLTTDLSGVSGKVTTVENKQATLSQSLEGFKTTVSNTYSTKTELSNLSGTVSTISSKVSTAESSITQLKNQITQKVESTEVNSIVNNAVNNVQIGGRNLLRNSSLEGITFPYSSTEYNWRTATVNPSSTLIRTRELIKDCPAFPQGIYGIKFVNTSTTDAKLEIAQDGRVMEHNETYTLSAYFKLTKGTANYRIQYGTTPYYNKVIVGSSGWVKHSFTFTYDATQFSNATTTNIYFGIHGNSFEGYACGFRLEKGTKATDWTPASEDVDSAISTVDTKIETTNNKVATIETSLSSITQRVSSTESNISTINGNVSSLQSRMSSAESKITSSAIVSTVRSSTAYTSDLNAKANQSALNTTNNNVSSLITRVNTVEQSITATAITTTISSAITGGTGSISTTQFVMDKNGLTIKNGALTVKNNAGQIVLQGDSNGDLTFKGKLQPNDYQVKLFGNDCKIDGSAGAIRMQWNPQTYVSVEDPYIRTFNKYSSNGTNYGSMGVNSEGHFTIFGQRTMIKLLGNSSDTAIVQARWTSDTAYAAFAGSDFLNRSTIKDKTNVETIEEVDFSKILLENNIFKYNLKTDVESVLNRFGLDEEYNSDEVVSSSADTKLGFILEELTDEAKALLNPYDEDAISVYSMCSILWKVCQEQQKRIEVLESKVI